MSIENFQSETLKLKVSIEGAFTNNAKNVYYKQNF